MDAHVLIGKSSSLIRLAVDRGVFHVRSFKTNVGTHHVLSVAFPFRSSRTLSLSLCVCVFFFLIGLVYSSWCDVVYYETVVLSMLCSILVR